jgi:hypothetical protein
MKVTSFWLVLLLVLFVLAAGCLNNSFTPSTSEEATLSKKPSSGCTTIQSGELLTSTDEVITTGYDEWGYNYQAHMFKGIYENYRRPQLPYTKSPSNTYLIMKWNDAWLSNKDCDRDGLLDRHYGYDSYIGSGAWLTNHMWGEYEGEDGKTYKWNYFCKIVAVPKDAVLQDEDEDEDEDGDEVWYTADGEEIGPEIWGQFAIVEEVYNDQGTGEHGKLYLSPVGPGFGKF